MALKKSIEYKGVTLANSYWKVNKFYFNDIQNSCIIYIDGYADEAARQESIIENILESKTFEVGEVASIPFPTQEQMAGITNPRDLIALMLYNRLKAEEFFVDAIDC